jgi:hypothetical protein
MIAIVGYDVYGAYGENARAGTVVVDGLRVEGAVAAVR